MTIGHNSKRVQAGPISAGRLKGFIERIEKLEEERKAIGGDIKDVYSEAKGVGYDVATMRKVVRLRSMDAADRDEQKTLLDTYMHALETVDRIDDRLAAGQSQREIAATEGVSKTTVQRRGPILSSTEGPAETDHDLKTREDTDAAPRGPSLPTAPQDAGVCTTRAQSAPDGGVGADTNSVEGGAPNSVRDGGAPVATSTVGPAVTTQEAAMQELTEISEKHGLYDPGPIPPFLKRERVA